MDRGIANIHPGVKKDFENRKLHSKLFKIPTSVYPEAESISGNFRKSDLVSMEEAMSWDNELPHTRGF